MSSSSPALSYKKPRKDHISSSSSTPTTPILNTSSPNLSIASSTDSAVTDARHPHSVQQNTHRKISNRRKALQEFYHLQSNKQQETDAGSGTGLGTGENNSSTLKSPALRSTAAAVANSNLDHHKIDTVEDIGKFIEDSSMVEILKLRNSLQAKINSSNQRKKEIMYDNYHELIKLSKTLSKFCESKVSMSFQPECVDNLSGFKIFKQNSDSSVNDEIDFDTYMDDSIKELTGFNETRVKKMTLGGFDQVLDRLIQDAAESDTNASIIGISDINGGNDIVSHGDEEKPQVLANEIDYILGLPNMDLSEEEKERALSTIEKRLCSLGADTTLWHRINLVKLSIS
ncbi:hypothetical protein KGF56_000376 [Candida oxycetoniae]|uniref:Vacuolar protein sorting-associated protein 51 homolog n=1 Tax=Candida oxycetoniae TaxID=497107 RepID=A0AAI9T0T9_9ASCO|nr:uncharacterized protein KGF56_000376 [Candida oxycetoniae]KAI3406771.2 hypothetical protein KGF56_000376 [Candida oxycetoniae]